MACECVGRDVEFCVDVVLGGWILCVNPVRGASVETRGDAGGNSYVSENSRDIG